MSEVQKDTYQEEYDAAMAKLEAGDTSTSTVVKEETHEAETQTTEQTIVTKEEFDKLQKALKDTQRWAHKNSTELATLKREREELIKQQSRPAILDDNPGLEEAIKHIASPKEEVNPNSALIGTLEKALPELDGLLDVPEFKEQFLALRKDSIDEWLDDPLTAIRDINNLQTTYKSDKARNDALKDYEAKQKKLGSMTVPGGSGGKGISKEVDEAQLWRDMPKAEFDKKRAKTLGY
jgi:hypothetical protein